MIQTFGFEKKIFHSHVYCQIGGSQFFLFPILNLKLRLKISSEKIR